MPHRYPDFVTDVKIESKGNKRYALIVTVDSHKPETLVVIQKNPSKATEHISDLTINRVIQFIKKNVNNHPLLDRCGKIIFMNLISIYETYSEKLKMSQHGIFDQSNMEIIDTYCNKHSNVIIGWGDAPKGLFQEYEHIKLTVFEIFQRYSNTLYYIDSLSKAGNPKHGQRWAYTSKLLKFE